MILNQLSQYVNNMREGLTTLTLDVPDRLLTILETRSRYKTGVATPGYDWTHLRNSPDLMFYTGGDRDQSSENDPEVRTIMETWKDAMLPMQFLGTDLQQTVGIRAAKLTEEGYMLRNMADNDRSVLLDFIGTQMELTAYSLQAGRVNSLWGRSNGIQMTNRDRLPLSIPQLFDQESGLYGEAPGVLGGFERQHIWHGDGAFGSSADDLMLPRLWDFAYERGYNGTTHAVAGRTATALEQQPAAGGTTRTALNGEARGILLADGTLDENTFQDLHQVVTQYSQVVPGRKIAICNNETFSALAIGFRGDNQPTVNLDKWSYGIRCVQIDDVYFISDPNKSPDSTTIEIYDIGSEGGSRGTLFPFYWDSGASVRRAMQAKVDSKLRDVPDGLTFGPRRRIPIDVDPFTRFEGMADAVGTRLRLSYMIICTHPERQFQIINIAARRRTSNNVVTSYQ